MNKKQRHPLVLLFSAMTFLLPPLTSSGQQLGSQDVSPREFNWPKEEEANCLPSPEQKIKLRPRQLKSLMNKWLLMKELNSQDFNRILGEKYNSLGQLENKLQTALDQQEKEMIKNKSVWDQIPATLLTPSQDTPSPSGPSLTQTTADRQSPVDTIIERALDYTLKGKGKISHSYYMSVTDVHALYEKVGRLKTNSGKGQKLAIFGPKIKGYEKSKGRLVINLNANGKSYHILIKGTENPLSELGQKMAKAFPNCYEYDLERENDRIIGRKF